MSLVVIISGSGTNLQALIDSISSGILKAEIKLVVANRGNAYGLKRAG
jgi:phosphoribosylglycinamide formyltransferase-1